MEGVLLVGGGRGSQKVFAAVPPMMAACVMARVMSVVGRGSRSISGVDPQVYPWVVRVLVVVPPGIRNSARRVWRMHCIQ